VSCGDGWRDCQHLNLGPHPYQRSAPGPVSAGSRLRPAHRRTVGDRWEPLGSDGVWPKRGPVTSRSWGQQRSASRTLAGKETPPAAPDKRARLAIALLGGALAGSRPGTSPLCRRCPWSAKLYPSALLVQTVHTTMAVWRKEQRNQCKPRPAAPLHAKLDRAGSSPAKERSRPGGGRQSVCPCLSARN
jgi:hypothetical protein